MIFFFLDEKETKSLYASSSESWHSWWLFEYFFAAEKSIIKKSE